MAANALQRALIRAGLAEEVKDRKPRGKNFKCHRCGAPMIKIEDTNVMSCSNDRCNNFFVFDKVM